jgi:hypothetical protein
MDIVGDQVVALLEGVDQVAPKPAVQFDPNDLVLLAAEQGAHLALGFVHHAVGAAGEAVVAGGDGLFVVRSQVPDMLLGRAFRKGRGIDAVLAHLGAVAKAHGPIKVGMDTEDKEALLVLRFQPRSSLGVGAENLAQTEHILAWSLVSGRVYSIGVRSDGHIARNDVDSVESYVFRFRAARGGLDHSG